MRTALTVLLLAFPLATQAAPPTTRPSAAASTRPTIPDAALSTALARAHELTNQSPDFPATLQAVAPAFQSIDPNTTPDQPLWHKVTLNRLGKRVDAVRFRTPTPAPGQKLHDLTWALAFPPDSLQGWYIIPATPGQTMKGFTDFYRTDVAALNNKDIPATHKALAQRLPAANLKPDTEYLLWFTFATDQPADLHLTLAFNPTPRPPVLQSTLQALGLQPQK